MEVIDVEVIYQIQQVDQAVEVEELMVQDLDLLIKQLETTEQVTLVAVEVVEVEYIHLHLLKKVEEELVVAEL